MLSSCGDDRKSPHVPLWSGSTQTTFSKQSSRIFITPDLHDLVLLISPERPSDEPLVPIRVPLNNATIPTFRASVSVNKAAYRYDYSVSNAPAARDFIIGFGIIAPPLLLGTNASYEGDAAGGPRHWGAVINFWPGLPQTELDPKLLGRSILWMSDWDRENANSESYKISPGRKMTGFRVESTLRPGFTTGRAIGLSYQPPENVLEDSDIMRQLHDLHVEDYFEVTAPTFGPMFLPAVEPAEVLRNYRMGIARLMRCTDIPRGAEFLNEIFKILELPDIDHRLAATLDRLGSKPETPIELELMNCLRLVAESFQTGQGKAGAK